MFSYDTATTLGRINQITKRRALWLRQGLGVPSGVRPLPDGKLLASGKKKKKKICQELAESQPQSEVQRQNSKPW